MMQLVHDQVVLGVNECVRDEGGMRSLKIFPGPADPAGDHDEGNDIFGQFRHRAQMMHGFYEHLNTLVLVFIAATDPDQQRIAVQCIADGLFRYSKQYFPGSLACRMWALPFGIKSFQNRWE